MPPPHESSLERTIERGATATYYFTIQDGIFREKLIPVQAVMLIGRDPENDIQFSDRSVSKRHALVLLLGGEYVIVDLGSLNGIFINGERSELPPSKLGGFVSRTSSADRLLTAGYAVL